MYKTFPQMAPLEEQTMKVVMWQLVYVDEIIGGLTRYYDARAQKAHDF